MRKTYKKIIALCAVLIFALALIPITAFADPFTAIAVGGIGGASGAGLFGSMAGASGISIGFSNTTVDQADALWNGLNPDHVYFDGEKGQVTEPDPVTGTPTVYDYITVDIGDWLQAQNDFIDEFVSEYQITDNSSGTISIAPSYSGYAFTDITYIQGVNRRKGSLCFIADGSTSYSLGSFTVIQRPYSLPNYKYVTISNGQTAVENYFDNNTQFYLCVPSTGSVQFCWTTNGSNYYLTGPTVQGYDSGTSVNYNSGIINTGVFDGYTAAKVKIPASSWSPSDPTNWNVAEFLEELTVKLVSDHASDIIIEDDQGPTPPPVPIPSTPLGDIPTDEWYDLFGLPVLDGQEEIHQDLQDFNDSVSDGLSDLGDQLDDTNDNLESIDTNIGIGNGLLGDLKTLGQSIVSKLDSILQGVQDLVQEIVLSTETFIAGLLNSIMGGLGGWLSTMREAFSIWHYVVEWVGSISTVFSWFWSVAGSTSYYIQLPIYASLAGAVVLAFYKRFGK